MFPTRRTLPDNIADGGGLLDAAAIAQIRDELWPDVRDEHELHDLLLSLVALPLRWLETQARDVRVRPARGRAVRSASGAWAGV